MCEVIDLRKWKEQKQGKRTTEDGLKQAMRNSLDNEQVKRKYGLKAEPTLEQRQERIKESLKRINNLMDQLNSNNKEST